MEIDEYDFIGLPTPFVDKPLLGECMGPWK